MLSWTKLRSAAHYLCKLSLHWLLLCSYYVKTRLSSFESQPKKFVVVVVIVVVVVVCVVIFVVVLVLLLLLLSLRLFHETHL